MKYKARRPASVWGDRGGTAGRGNLVKMRKKPKKKDTEEASFLNPNNCSTDRPPRSRQLKWFFFVREGAEHTTEA